MTGASAEGLLGWLGDWYLSQCDGEWEQVFGVEISTLDNPGWSVEIDLAGTALANCPAFDEWCGSEGDVDWRRCWIDASTGTFKGAGGPTALVAILERFRRLVQPGRGHSPDTDESS